MPVFRIPNITDDGLSFEDLKFLSHKDISDENQIHENDILIVRSNGSRAVSYTHLDVYKRQDETGDDWRNHREPDVYL